MSVNKQTDSIFDAASTVAHDLMSYYTGNQPGSSSVGLLPPPYYWWEAGAMWGTMISYWAYTGDTTYNDEVGRAILSQAGPRNDFIMPNQVFDTGNDDQAFWALTAMSAIEYGLPVPSGSDVSSNEYLDLAINSFNDFVSRWNTSTCNGGLQWQFTPTNVGFYYKSSVANGGFFQLAARLARYTGNVTYLEWAEKEWDWMTGVRYIDETTYSVIDGAQCGDGLNCTAFSTQEWTYNNAITLYGAAVLYSINKSPEWLQRTEGLLAHATTQFFSPYANSTGVMYEHQCEESGTCDNDQFSFKAYLARWMAATAILVPSLRSNVRALLVPSGEAAVEACSGGPSGSQCGTKWYVGGFDGVTGLGQEMSALEVILGTLV